jgi:hypothetical protein
MQQKWILAFAATALLSASQVSADVLETSDEPSTATPGPGEAVVYFVRPASLGFAIHFFAYIDETTAGATKGNTYTWVTVPAGEHVIWSRSGNVSAMRMNLEAGKSYYVEQRVRMGGVKARVSLEVMDEAEALEAIAECKYTTLTEEGMARAAEHLAADYAEAVAAADEAQASAAATASTASR